MGNKIVGHVIVLNDYNCELGEGKAHLSTFFSELLSKNVPFAIDGSESHIRKITRCDNNVIIYVIFDGEKLNIDRLNKCKKNANVVCISVSASTETEDKIEKNKMIQITQTICKDDVIKYSFDPSIVGILA